MIGWNIVDNGGIGVPDCRFLPKVLLWLPVLVTGVVVDVVIGVATGVAADVVIGVATGVVDGVVFILIKFGWFILVNPCGLVNAGCGTDIVTDTDLLLVVVGAAVGSWKNPSASGRIRLLRTFDRRRIHFGIFLIAAFFFAFIFLFLLDFDCFKIKFSCSLGCYRKAIPYFFVFEAHFVYLFETHFEK